MVLVIRKLYMHSQSFALPDFPDCGYGYLRDLFDSQQHAATQYVFSFGQLHFNWLQMHVSGSTLRIGLCHFFQFAFSAIFYL